MTLRHTTFVASLKKDKNCRANLAIHTYVTVSLYGAGDVCAAHSWHVRH